MTPYVLLGHYHELHPGSLDAPSLRSAVNVRNYGPAEKFHLLNYLNGGIVLAVSPGVEFDVLDPGGNPVGTRAPAG